MLRNRIGTAGLVLALLVGALLPAGVWQAPTVAADAESEAASLRADVAELRAQLGAVRSEMAALKKRVVDLEQQLAAKTAAPLPLTRGTSPTTQPPPVAPEPVKPKPADTTTVYITATGSKYHRAGCSYLRSSSIAVPRSEAIARGMGPCSRCSP